ncbi:MAG TPA: fused MFS/spermidine synthase [Pseudolabrys sp.]
MTKKQVQRSKAPGHAIVLGAYVAAIFLSALLLFGVQPMFTHMVLPRLGGSPSVWSVAMVFFQSMLLAGYLYAHFMSGLRHRYAPIAIHLGLLIVAALTLPLTIAQGWGNPPVTAAAPFWLLGLFAVSIGLPFFALAATNPLLQTWFVRTGHHDAHDPYFLYAASNVGSFLALLSYPIFFEPVFPLHAQNQLWRIGFLLLIALIASCATLMLMAPTRAARRAKVKSGPKPTWSEIGRWIFVSAIPSGLLVAVTAYISADVAAAPLLWVIPLALYLLTWVLVFQRKPMIPHRIALLLQPIAIAGIILLLLYAGWIPLLPNFSAHLTAFFIIAMACHGELARTRPAAQHLTTFYVSLSLGGMIGGLFSGLIAPYAFPWVAEYPALTVLAVLCRPFGQAIWKPFNRWLWPLASSYWPKLAEKFWSAAIIIATLLIAPSVVDFRFDAETDFLLTVLVVTLAAASLALLRDPPKSAWAAALAFAMIWLYPADENHTETVRSFFGVHKVYETDDGRFRILKHGSTIHGAQMLETEDGEPAPDRPQPITYYHDKSAINQVILSVRARKRGPLRAAVIGLGAGSLACRIAPGESWRFFEIDPAVIAIARDPKRFSFLSSCAPDLPIVVGDARLTFAREPDHVYDLIIVDAYSSDAIPVHLATREAMAIYKTKLAPQGVVLMHISNRHLELQSVIAGIAAANGLKTWIWSNDNEESDDDNYIFPSDVAVSAESDADIGMLIWDKLWVLTPPDPALRTWTDDYSNIAGAIWRKYNK